MIRSIAIWGMAALFVSIHGFELNARENIAFNTDWRFSKGNPVGAHEPGFDDSGWIPVRLPHDWAIYGPFDPLGDPNTGKLPWRGEGWYRKTFNVPIENQGKKIYFIFDGIMAFPKIYVNGQLSGSWDYGYNSFFLDVTEHIQIGNSNTIAIYVDTREHDSRWYPGAGIYRKIRMLVVDPVHIGIWGTFISTPEVKENWSDIRVISTIRNHLEEDISVLVRHQVLNPGGGVVVEDTMSHLVESGKEKVFEQWFTLLKPRRWDIDHPVLYSVNTIVSQDGSVCDSEVTPLGIRTFKFTSDDGFYLNGRKVMFKGVNLHHDHGPLGARFYRRAMERQLEIMREMGCNAIRTSHNVAAPELLDLCDSMGFLVIDEAFDKYDRKADIFPGTDFYEFGERNMRNFVMRDRNHPSIILWSVGNEMGDIQSNRNDGLLKLQAMVSYVRKYDPTRPVTMVCDNMGSVKWRHFDYYDVHSWNYNRRYLPARKADPGKAVILAESASTLSSRGFYEFPFPEERTDFTNSLQISSYDVHAPWWAEIPDDDFTWMEEDHYVCGEFVWTGFDYLGEPTPYTNFMVRSGRITQEQTAKSSFFGIVDLCGIPKDRYYLYKSQWKPDEDMVHVLPHWNWGGMEGKGIPVMAYTNGECVELFVNGTSAGKRCKDPKAENTMLRYRLIWDSVTYQRGTLTARAFKEGKLIAETEVHTSETPHQLQLTADRNKIQPTGEDLAYILVEALDKNGHFCPLAENQVTFSVMGPAHIEAVGNGDPQSIEPFISNQRKLFFGKAMLILRTHESEPGEIEITASSPGLRSSSIKLISGNP
jgi:beta-galactosidase